MNLDFINSVILIEWLEKHDKTRLEVAKKTGRTYGNKFDSVYIENYFRVKKGYEIVKNDLCKNFNILEKLIVISNCSIPNDSEFVKILYCYGFDNEKCIELNNLIKKMLILKKHKKAINLDLSLLEEINNISKSIFGFACPSVIINRINDIYVTRKDLFEKESVKKY